MFTVGPKTDQSGQLFHQSYLPHSGAVEGVDCYGEECLIAHAVFLIGRYSAKIDAFDAILAEYRMFFVKITIFEEKLRL